MLLVEHILSYVPIVCQGCSRPVWTEDGLYHLPYGGLLALRETRKAASWLMAALLFALKNNGAVALAECDFQAPDT